LKQAERQARSRKEILEAALDEFSCQPYGAVTIDGLCARHGISKGMFYHYFKNKESLFLSLVGQVFQGLAAYLSQWMAQASFADTAPTIQAFFLARAYYFAQHPQEKPIFETAMFHRPPQLAEQIAQLHAPLEAINHDFLFQVFSQLPLRPGLDRETVYRYFSGVECVFWPLLDRFRAEGPVEDVQSLVSASAALLDILIFGVVDPLRR